MRILRTALVWLLIAGVGTPAYADGLRASAARAAERAGQASGSSMPKPYLWVGTGLFVGGMAAGLYGFLNNKNGSFPEFGEAESTNATLGTIGLITAFAGGTVLFLGTRRASSPSVTFGPGKVTVSKQLSW